MPQTPHTPQLSQQVPLRILLAEDNTVNQQVALLMLKQLGYRADVVRNGQEVLEALRRQPYDVVLMDVEMPHMDGLTATRLICQEWPTLISPTDELIESPKSTLPKFLTKGNQNPNSKRPRIIAMTAYAMAGDRAKCIEAGMDDYLSKPIQEKELLRALQQCQPGTDKNDLVGDSNPTSVPLHTLSSALPTSGESQAILDQRVLKSLRQIAGNSLSELIDNYLEDAAQLLQSIREAVAAGNAKALRQAAHTLRSSSANLGATTLSKLCKELEIMGSAGTITNAPEFIARIEVEYEKVKVALNRENAQISQ